MNPQEIITKRLKESGSSFPDSVAKSIIIRLETHDYHITKIHPDHPNHSHKQELRGEGVFKKAGII